MITFKIRVDDTIQPTLELLKFSYGMTGPATAVFRDPSIRGDDAGVVLQNSHIEISADDFETLCFNGWVREIKPAPVGASGVEYTAIDMRGRMETEIRAQRNGGYRWSYNERSNSNPTAPGYGWHKFWKVGEIICDVLEHALGFPQLTGTNLPSHHTDEGDVTDTYLTTDDIASYDGEAILAMDREIVSFDVMGQTLGEVLTFLCDEQTDYGWWIDPATGTLEIWNIADSEAVNVNAGQLGHWVDESGVTYNLQANRNMTFSLNQVYTKVTIQGMDKCMEIKPSNIVYPVGIDPSGVGNAEMEKGWNPALEGSWSEEEFEAGTYTGDDAYEWVWRRWIPKAESQWPWCSGTVNASPYIFSGQAFYGDTVNGDKSKCTAGTTGSYIVYLDVGTLLFWHPVHPDYRNKKFFCWYRHYAPFTVSVGPGGSAYEDYGHVAEHLICDDDFEHSSSRWPSWSGNPNNTADIRDDTDRMEDIATTLHGMLSREIKSFELQISPIDMATYTLKKKVNLANLEQWADIGLQILSIDVEPPTNRMTLHCANTLSGGTEKAMKHYAQMKVVWQRKQDMKLLKRWMKVLRKRSGWYYEGT